MDRDAEASARFACSDRERAVFEAGIKMGTIYHQFVGTPFDRNSVEELEALIGHTIEVQPYVESAEIHIDRSGFKGERETYSYISLTGDMIDAKVVISYMGTRVTAEMRYDSELRYPLMYVSDVQTT